MLVRQLTAARVTRYNRLMVSEATIILASGSQRRREIIEALDATVEIVPSGVDERPANPQERAEEYVARIASDKARAVAANGRAGALVIGADTSVVLNGGVLGKPENEAEARTMLSALRGRSPQGCYRSDGKAQRH